MMIVAWCLRFITIAAARWRPTLITPSNDLNFTAFLKCMSLQKIVRRFLLFSFLIAISGLGFSQENIDSVAEYQVKAAFLYKFCLYVEWPPNAFANSDSPIVLGVAGPDNLITELINVTKKHTINGRPLQVRPIDNNASLVGLHLLFIARSEQNRLSTLVSQAQKLPLLLVTESPTTLDDGSTISFVIQDNRVRFDVDLDSANRQGLHLSAQLLKVARNVRGEGRP